MHSTNMTPKALSREMRSREEIYKDIGGKVFPSGFGVIIELLLDIRDLLANPPIEISGAGLTKENK